MRLWLTTLVLASGTMIVASADNFPLGAYIYRGSVMNYKHEVSSSADRSVSVK